MPGFDDLTLTEASLLHLVEPTTFLRGRQYARAGYVVTAMWTLPRAVATGTVHGSRSAPYGVSVRMRMVGPRVTEFVGECECPVTFDCKHAVALTLTLLAGDRTELASPAPARAWEAPLRDLLDDEPRADDEAQIAIGFDLSDTSPQRVAIRPMVRGRSGWVRSGVSWQSVGSAWGAPRGVTPSQLQLLREIVALEHVGSSYYYGGTSRPIYLDDMVSGRIWDILADAETVQIPLVTGRAGTEPVRLVREPARADLRLEHDAGDLVVAPAVHVGDADVPLDEVLLIGSPPHGLAMMIPSSAATGARGAESLLLAPLAERLDPVTLRLIQSRGVRVPAADEAEFLTRYLPPLRQRVAISVAPDVDVPEPEPPVLVLDLTAAAVDDLVLRWHWRYPIGALDRSEALWPRAPGGRGTRDAEHEAVVVKAVAEAVGHLPELFQPTLGGVRLAESAALTGVSALRFVADVLPVLEALPDVAVTVDAELARVREATAAPDVAVAAQQATERDWFDLAVTVSVDGEEVPFDRLFVALATGQPYFVLPSGTWFTLDRPELETLRELIAEARALNDVGPQSARVSRYQSDLWAWLEELGVVDEQVSRWRAALAALDETAEVQPVALPPGLHATLRPYQADGFAWLSFLHRHGLGGILADEMGLGKTLQTLALICQAKSDGETRPFLVVAPTSVVYTWASECSRFAPELQVRLVTETTRRSGTSVPASAEGVDVVVTSYALFRLDIDSYRQVAWGGLVLDEAQFVKNPQSQAYACAKRLEAPFKLAITGTPMENNLGELWSLLSITAPGLFPHPRRFDEHFRHPIERQRDSDRLALLRQRIRPFLLRRTKEHVAADLPPKQEQVLELPLNPRHRKIYDTHLQRERQKVLGLLGDLEKNRFEIFRSLTLLRQACLDPALIDEAYAGVAATKLDALMELVTEVVSEGHRTLVFSQFTRFLGAARRRLDAAGVDYCYLDGTTRHRAEEIERFRTGTAPVFLISLKAGGFGLTLTEADYCILLDPWWNPATENQAIDRTHRIGQSRPVMIYRLVAKDTIEDKVMALKARKAALFDSVLADGDAAAAKLTAADIRGILD